MKRRVLFALAVAAVVAGCGSSKPKPMALENVKPTIAGREVWRARLDSVEFPLAVVVRDDKFRVAGSDGTILVLDGQSGKEVSRARVAGKISAGLGSDGRFDAVVTTGNELVVVEGDRELWRKRLSSRVVTAPLVAGERVFVTGVDRAVQAFDVLDGRLLWRLQRPSDALTLSQPGVVAAFKDTLLVGQGPRLTGVDSLRGTVQWEVAMASPRGTNEVERLADLLGPALRLGDKFCARSFQSAVACVDASKGTLLWSRNVGGVQPVGGNDTAIFGADGTGRVSAWRADSGEVLWTNERLLYRGLSAPLALGPSVVFGDYEGYVHFLSAATGETQLRLPTDGSAIVAAPVLSGTTMLVVTRKGGLYAFRPN
ncbi:outer membrane protein assembly factor BamB [Rubrivivax gelatinosus]|uniref:Outer membrane protein assembly factor BamB n=1 Tax=Rubrivivax gelatinosus TaxID=28068 RepID=A0A4V2SHC4_RUBGE|nr:outer membrane protein assembly factor BamB [Rubrivivax gelatinosus]MBK1688635.1 outer membrane protein assembly factor BamB [Rubrivivax gelatinosus]TCP04538.1 Beta-barrel assembly machine subunit BamB [Rubrivivax gelatinosus]